MPRSPRIAPGGQIYHVLNRTVGKMHMLRRPEDYAAFERIILEAADRHPIRILAYCLLSTHWHFVVHPARDGQLTDFFRWLTHTHAMRWRVAHHSVGYGPLYQGRFKSFPVQRDEHFLTLCRYVERNALTAGLVRRAQDWPHSSLYARQHGDRELKSLLSPWPIDRPHNWTHLVNTPLTVREQERLDTSLQRGRPYGTDPWTLRTATRLGLNHTLRREGRPSSKPAKQAMAGDETDR